MVGGCVHCGVRGRVVLLLLLVVLVVVVCLAELVYVDPAVCVVNMTQVRVRHVGAVRTHGAVCVSRCSIIVSVG